MWVYGTFFSIPVDFPSKPAKAHRENRMMCKVIPLVFDSQSHAEVFIFGISWSINQSAVGVLMTFSSVVQNHLLTGCSEDRFT